MQNGFICIENGRYARLSRQPTGRVIDAGRVCITSSLVNAHSHLDLSDLASPIPYEGSFTNWIRNVVAHRTSNTDDKTYNKASIINKGLVESRSTGCETCFDIIANYHSDSYLSADQPFVIPHAELIGVSPEREEQTWGCFEQLMADNENFAHIGISPHAPYTTTIPLLKRACEVSQLRRTSVAIHLAETLTERDWLSNRAGELHDFISPLIPPSVLNLQLRDYETAFDILSQSYRTLLIHGNYLTASEMDQIARLQTHMAVVFCPRTHRYFGHEPYPLSEIIKRRIPVFLGTDSLASNPDLSILTEARFVAQNHADVSVTDIWKMITDGPREFMQMSIDCDPGSMLAFPLHDRCENLHDVLSQILHQSDMPTRI